MDFFSVLTIGEPKTLVSTNSQNALYRTYMSGSFNNLLFSSSYEGSEAEMEQSSSTNVQPFPLCCCCKSKPIPPRLTCTLHMHKVVSVALHSATQLAKPKFCKALGSPSLLTVICYLWQWQIKNHHHIGSQLSSCYVQRSWLKKQTFPLDLINSHEKDENNAPKQHAHEAAPHRVR